MQSEIKIPVKLTLDVDGETATAALFLVQVYCNKMGLLPIGKRQGDGTIEFEFMKDYRK